MTKTNKQSYTIPCASSFRDAAEALAAKRRVNVGDLARSVMLMLEPNEINAFPDPGEPMGGDRETVTLKSGPAVGRPWRRKPRLQVRMTPGLDALFIRRALGIALAMDKGEVMLKLGSPNALPATTRPDLMDELERLRTMVTALSFDPLPDGVRNRDDALHVLGFPPRSVPDSHTLRARFRMLATIHHPDGQTGSHQRMSQLNAAMEVLRGS
ncbi:MAG: molecular chaperone DnaJ [Alphaproteobacteria bacterium RIFOXYD12_FULL_60_8]|nr:MAG: molecular chaperone DnaJ [Alphaproteobacteria bacterium RIFOXYD12_FULL_60_8]